MDVERFLACFKRPVARLRSKLGTLSLARISQINWNEDALRSVGL